MLRIIYALRITLTTSDATIGQLIAPLDRQGQSIACRAIGKPRVIDLRPGDQIERDGQLRTIETVEAFRAANVDDGYLEAAQSDDGYVFRPKQTEGRP